MNLYDFVETNLLERVQHIQKTKDKTDVGWNRTQFAYFERADDQFAVT